MFVTGGGCSGFQYGFTFDEVQNEDDAVMEKNGVTLLIDPMSYQYLVGAEIDYQEGLEGAQFVIKNPNAHEHLRLRLVVLDLSPERGHREKGLRPLFHFVGRRSTNACFLERLGAEARRRAGARRSAPKDYGSTTSFRDLYRGGRVRRRRSRGGHRASTGCADLTAAPGRRWHAPGTFALAICCSVLEHTPDQPWVHGRRTSARLRRPDGAASTGARCPWAGATTPIRDDYFPASRRAAMQALLPRAVE